MLAVCYFLKLYPARIWNVWSLYCADLNNASYVMLECKMVKLLMFFKRQSCVDVIYSSEIFHIDALCSMYAITRKVYVCLGKLCSSLHTAKIQSARALQVPSAKPSSAFVGLLSNCTHRVVTHFLTMCMPDQF